MSERVPEGWDVCQLSSVLELHHGYQFRSPDFRDTGIKVIKIGQVVGQGKLDLTECNNISEELAEQKKEFLLSSGDILMSLTGNIGRVGVVPEINFPLIQNYRVGKFVPKLERVEPDFLAHLLGSSFVTLQLDTNSNTTAQANFGKADIDKVTIDVPPLPEQKKIASILTSVDEVIETTQRQIDKLQDLKKATMNELLTKGIGHTEFKDSALGRIPKSWEVKILQDVSQEKGIQTGPFGSQLHAHEYTLFGVPVIMPKDMKSQRVNTLSIARIPEERAASLKKHRVQEGDILFSRRGDIGRFALIDKQAVGWVCGTGCLRVRLDRQLSHPYFMAQYLTKDEPIEWLNLNAVGLTMLNISTGILKPLPVLVPPLDEQIRIVDVLKAIDQRLLDCLHLKDKTRTLKKSLMQDLLTGKVRVQVN